jgi:hypothetical protein
MTDWDEREIDASTDDDDELELIGVPYDSIERSGGMKWPLVGGALALMAVVAILLYGFLSGVSEVPQTIRGDVSEKTEPETLAPVPAEEPEPAADAPELPKLQESDGFVRELLTALSSHAGLASYFLSDDLIRKGVVVVVNVAEGDPPARHFRDLAPEEPFGVVRRGARLYVDPLSYRRYDPLAAGFASLDPEGVADLYRTVKPLVDEAYDELGYLDEPFDTVLAKAFRVLLDTPVRESPPEVYAESVNYAYTDPSLQSLTPAQKQLLRMGPKNVRKIQAELTKIAQALDLPIPATS